MSFIDLKQINNAQLTSFVNGLITGSINSGFSGYNNIVYQTGDQNISGIKTFSGALKVLSFNGTDLLNVTNVGFTINNFNGVTILDSAGYYLADEGGNETLGWREKQLFGGWTNFGIFVVQDVNASTPIVITDPLSGICINNIDGNPIFNTTEDYAYFTNGANIVFSTEDGSLNALDGANSIGWYSRTLSNSSGIPVLDWSNRQLSGDWSTNTSPTNPNHLINLNYLSNQAVSVTGGAQNILGDKTFLDSLTIDGILLFNNNQSYVTADGDIYNNGDTLLLSPTSYGTFNSAGAQTINWNLRYLSGNWITNTIPTLSGHLINKGYFDANSGSILNSTVVRTTGSQQITGVKSFNQGLTVNTNAGNFRVGSQGGQYYILANQFGFKLCAYTGFQSIDVENRLLCDISGNTTADYANRQLTGNWLTDTTPTNSGHLINKYYLDSIVNSVTGQNIVSNATLNWSSGASFFNTLTGNVNFNFTGQRNGQSINLVTYSTGNYLVSFPTGIKWPGSVIFSGTSGNGATGKYDYWSFSQVNNFIFGQYSPNHF